MNITGLIENIWKLMLYLCYLLLIYLLEKNKGVP